MSYLNVLLFLLLGIGFGGFGIENSSAQDLAQETKLIFFYGNSPNLNASYEVAEADKILKHPKFNRNHKTVLYLHGFVESPASATVQLIVNAYIKRGTHNILVLDWSSLVNGSYVTAVENAYEIGPTFAEVLIDLFKKGINRLQFHLVGHSLGGQLAGIIGRSTIQVSNNKIKLLRISALDPAGPLFYPPLDGKLAINKRDATLVDIIHTDAGNYGSPVDTGDVDFMVNTGTRFQPGCPVGNFTALDPNDTCSHQRSVALWSESVATFYPTFLATNNKFKFVKIHMGIDCPIYLPGIYTLETNSASPFSKYN